MNYIAQVFGFSAIGISFFIYSRKKRRHILICKLLQDIFWMSHYFLLGAYSAAVTNMICATREILFFSENSHVSKKTITFSFIAFYLISAILTWKNVFSIFPALASTFSTIAFSLKKPIHTKLIAIPSSLCTFVYNVTTSHSVSVYVGISITLSTLCFSLVETALIPYIRQKKEKESCYEERKN